MHIELANDNSDTSFGLTGGVATVSEDITTTGSSSVPRNKRIAGTVAYSLEDERTMMSLLFWVFNREGVVGDEQENCSLLSIVESTKSRAVL